MMANQLEVASNLCQTLMFRLFDVCHNDHINKCTNVQKIRKYSTQDEEEKVGKKNGFVTKERRESIEKKKIIVEKQTTTFV